MRNANLSDQKRQGKRTKFDRSVDPNIQGAQSRVNLDPQIYRN